MRRQVDVDEENILVLVRVLHRDHDCDGHNHDGSLLHRDHDCDGRDHDGS